MKPLNGKIALVAGATRGAGRGIALALAEAGAKVWCTGRSTKANRAQRAGPFELAGRPETVEETARLCGGEAVIVDHTDEAQVREKGGRVFASWTLANEYGFTDADGRKPDWGTHFASIEANL